MRIKDLTVKCEFHPKLIDFLFWVDERYREWGDELVITSGSEQSAEHSRTSLHYSGQAADIRIWDKEFHNRAQVPNKSIQHSAIKQSAKHYLLHYKLPLDWIDVVLEKTHIHIEYQPKRIDK